MNQQLRKTDNGVRKFINPGWVAVIILVSGYIVLLVSNTKTIPALTRIVRSNERCITELQTNYEWILKGIDELKDLIKER